MTKRYKFTLKKNYHYNLLKSSNLKERLFDNNSKLPLIITDKKGLIVDINPKITDIFGYSKKELIDKSINSLSLETNCITNVLRKKDNLIIVQFKTKNNEIFNAVLSLIFPIINSNVILFIFLKIPKFNKHQKIMLNETSAALFIINSKNIIKYANIAFKEFFHGINIINQNFESLIHKNDIQLFYSLIFNTILDSYDKEKIRIISSQNKIIYLEIHFNVITQNNKKFLFGTALDITEKIKLRKKIIQNNTKKHLESINTNLIHDLKNALVSITGPIDLIKQQNKNNKNIISNLNLIERSLNIMIEKAKIHLSNQDINKNPILYDINEFINSNLEYFKNTVINKKIKIFTTLEKETIIIEGCKEKLYYIVLNLLYNARDAINNEGIIKISTQKIDKLPLKIKSKYSKNNSYVKLSVKDNGMGIPENIIDNIFNKNFTTKQNFSGNGLGLTIVKNDIEKYFRGHITVNSKIGEGTIFNIFIPIVSQNIYVSNKSYNFFILDDDPIILQITKELLEILEHKVTTSTDPVKSIEILNSENNFNFIIIDKNLGEISGEEVFKYVKQNNPKAKFILSTGYIDSKDYKKLYDLGFDKIINKPYKIETLNRIINSLS